MKRAFVGLAALVLSLGVAGQTQASITVYNSQVSPTAHDDFLAALAADPAPWTNTFPGNIGQELSPLSWTSPGGVFSYTAECTPFDPNTGFGGFYSGPSGNQLSTDFSGDPIIFHLGAGGNIFGAGGALYLTDQFFATIPGMQDITADNGVDLPVTVTLTDAAPTTFLGFVSDVPLVSLTLTPPGGQPFSWATVGDFIVGTAGGGGKSPNAAPEPSTLALLGIGALGLVGYGWRRRK